MILKSKQLWRLWCKALGEKTGKSNNEADLIAIIRSAILLTYVVTNGFIIAGVVKHWNDGERCSKCEHLEYQKNG
jgi:hypothetical protein